MTHARVFQHGVKAYLDCKLLDGNPYDPAVDPEAHDAWSDGWLDASRVRRRIHSLEIAANSNITGSLLFAHRA